MSKVQTPKTQFQIKRFFELVDTLNKYSADQIRIHIPSNLDDPEIQEYDAIIDTPDGSFGIKLQKIDRW